MKQIWIVILLLCMSGHSVILKPHMQSNKRDIDRTIDSLLTYLDPYFETPMSWCSIEPTDIVGDHRNGSNNKNYIFIQIDMDIECDNNQVIDAMNMAFRDAFSETPKGFMWDSIARFTRKMQARYPNIRATYQHGASLFNFVIDVSKGGVFKGSPLYGNIYINNELLVDDQINKDVYKSNDTFRFIVEDRDFATYYLPNHNLFDSDEMNNKSRSNRHYQASAVYAVNKNRAESIVANDIDVEIKRLYNIKTPGIGVDYSFKGFVK